MTTRVRFSHRTTVDACKPASLWQGKHHPKIPKCCLVKTSEELGCTFTVNKNAQLPAIRISEQPLLLTKSRICCLGYKFAKYFH